MTMGRAELVIADISEPNENVFYELGYAAGMRKQILLIAEKGVMVPTDLKGLQLIEYEPPRDRAKAEAFSNSLQADLQSS
jgi:predicted nucleotide-binding protein